MAEPQHFTYRLEVDYDPLSGMATVTDQWVDKARNDQPAALVMTSNLHRHGRDNLYREVKHQVAQFFDIMDWRAEREA